ncbi:MAG: Hpt domain-containing protein [Salinisphaeraceae bacterium]
MAQVKQITAGGLHWVHAELEYSLERVRSFVETFLDTPDNPLPLQRALVELHQIRGTLRMILCEGGAVFAEEMRVAVHDLLGDLEAAPERAFEALLGATVQLTDYLDALHNGETDNALVFLPLINELRVARGAGVIAESALFAHYAQLCEPLDSRSGPIEGRPDNAGQPRARQHLAPFQAALLGLLRDDATAETLGRLEQVAADLAQTVADRRGQRLFEAAAAVIEAIAADGLACELEIKRLLGRVGQQLKAAAANGDRALGDAPDALLYGLVYFVGRARTDGPRVAALREAYGLETLLPDPERLSRMRARLRGPNTGLVNKLAAEIREDIDSVKNAIDLVLRAGDRANVDMQATVATIRRVADTLAMLGLDMLMRVVRNQADAVTDLHERGEREYAAWMDVALALLNVEQSLDSALFQHLYRGQEPSPAAQPAPQQDVSRGMSAIHREARVNIARIRDLVPVFVESGDVELAAEAARLLREIEAGLHILSEEDGVDLAGRLNAFMGSQAMLGVRDDPARVRSLADAIVALEYYLEGLAGQPGRLPQLYEQARGYLSQLTVPPDQAEALVSDTSGFEDAEPVEPDVVDPEIRDIFLEEAGEVLANLQRDVPVWAGDLGDSERLAEIRRAFHTLKGSGRMVQADEIGEFGWAVEHLLNRCLEGAVPVDARVRRVVDDAVAALPALIEDFKAGRPPTAAAPVIGAAQAITGGGDTADGEAGGESELLRIFRADAKRHLQTLNGVAATVPPVRVPDKLIRSLHTLKGSAEAVGEISIVRIAAPLEQFADAARAAEFSLDAPALAVLGDAVTLVESFVVGDRHEIADTDIDGWLARLDQQRRALPAEAVDASDWRELMIVFTDEACDLVDAIEADLRDWRESPGDLHYPRSLRGRAHTLKGSARTADAGSMGQVAQEFEQLMQRYARGELPAPDAPALDVLDSVADGLYAMLDRFRHGDRSADPQPLLAALASLVPESGSATDAASTDDAENMAAPAGFESDTPHPDSTGASGEDDRTEQAPERVLAALTDSGPAGEDPAAPDDTPVAEPAEPEPLEQLSESELTGIFLGEADELLEGLAYQLDRWQMQPDSHRAPAEIMRLLHTLKGSARMAHITAVGDISHELEDRLGRTRQAPSAIPPLQTALESLRQILDSVRRGEPAPPAEPVLARLRETGESETTPDPAPIESAESAVPAPATDFEERLFWAPETAPAEDSSLPDTARIPVVDLDGMLNQAGEISIYRARLEQRNTELQAQLREMAQTTRRLRDQLRKLDLETESQIVARHAEDGDRYDAEFDPLEMDRYSALHEYSRSLAESTADLMSLHGSLTDLAEQDEVLLGQQARVNTSLQQGLMRTLMVPFARQEQRLQRLVRQVAGETERPVELFIRGGDEELDRSVLERMTAPIEHLLRNAVVHGIEPADQRRLAGKPAAGRIEITLFREGTQLVIEVGDDGRGLDLDTIVARARSLGLVAEDADVSEDAAARLIFQPGVSTADTLTQSAGRGVGLDVVAAEIRELGGGLTVAAGATAGTRFAIRLPLSLAISQALFVGVGEERYAVPMGSIEGVTRLSRDELKTAAAAEGEPTLDYAGQRYRLVELAEVLGVPDSAPGEDAPVNLPVILARAGEQRAAFVAHSMIGSREIVVKPVGPQVATVPGIAGATVLADGAVMVILDLAALVQTRMRAVPRPPAAATPAADARPLVLVVDDSITIRRVSERFLTRQGFRVGLAKDGMDALAQLQANPPDAVLLDIEMPRIDGFELATYMRNSQALRHTPIVMITSRSGDKHRRRAEQIGVDRFLTKPYQEEQLLAEIRSVLGREVEADDHG